jgi:hypothetical protein
MFDHEIFPNGQARDGTRTDPHERAPQFLGQAAFVFRGGVTTLEFVDWPVKVGIDNLRVSFTPVAHAPEPSPLALLGCGGLVGLAHEWATVLLGQLPALHPERFFNRST